VGGKGGGIKIRRLVGFDRRPVSCKIEKCRRSVKGDTVLKGPHCGHNWDAILVGVQIQWGAEKKKVRVLTSGEVFRVTVKQAKDEGTKQLA